MSDARRTPREVPTTESGPESVTSRLAAAYGNVYAGECSGFSFPMSPVYHEGHRLTAGEARVMNATRYARAKSTANSNLTRGPQAKLPEPEQVAWLTKYVREYKFTDAIGAEWAQNIVELAASRVIFSRGLAQGKRSGTFADYVGSPEAKKDEPIVVKVLADPALADRYEPLIRAEIEAILSEKHPTVKRVSKAGDVADVEI